LSGANVETLQYDYMQFHPTPSGSPGWRGRRLILEFKDFKLNGYLFISFFPAESALKNLSSDYLIKAGSHKKADVIKIAGEPNAKSKCPTLLRKFKRLCSQGKEIWLWEAYGTGESKYITVEFNDDGVVNKILSGTRKKK
jgi:hypothetical protein